MRGLEEELLHAGEYGDHHLPLLALYSGRSAAWRWLLCTLMPILTAINTNAQLSTYTARVSNQPPCKMFVARHRDTPLELPHSLQEEKFCDEFHLVDLRVYENCKTVVKGCDHVFNLAADMGGELAVLLCTTLPGVGSVCSFVSRHSLEPAAFAQSHQFDRRKVKASGILQAWASSRATILSSCTTTP